MSKTDHNSRWLALDVGGANLKAAHSSGRAMSVAFEVWKHPEGLSDAVARLASALPPSEGVALTMTAELCDCYATKRIGVIAIVDAVVRAFPGKLVLVWGLDRAFHPVDEIRREPLLAAAANWLALATYCARLIPQERGLLIDVGSTTTDLIPLDRGLPVPVGRTDTERLQSRELVYVGIRRTPVCALGTELPFRGVATGLAAELFATTLDVYLTLGDIPPDPLDRATADGQPATLDAARNRLARMVGADGETFSPEDARELADSADRALRNRLLAAMQRVCDRTIGEPEALIVSGSGEFLARRLAERADRPPIRILSLRETWSAGGSTSACAHAMLELIANHRP